MRTIRFARRHHLEDERAPNPLWRWIGVSPLKPMTVRFLSVSPVESVGERRGRRPPDTDLKQLL